MDAIRKIRVENVAELVVELLEGEADKYELADLAETMLEEARCAWDGMAHYTVSTREMPDGVYQTSVEIDGPNRKPSKICVYRTRDSFKAGYFHELLLTTARSRIYPNTKSWLKDTKAIYKAAFQLYEAEQKLKKAGVSLPLIPISLIPLYM